MKASRIDLGQHMSFIIAVQLKQRVWMRVAIVGAVLWPLAGVALLSPVTEVAAVPLAVVSVVLMIVSGVRLSRLHKFRMKARDYLASNTPHSA